MRYFLFCNDLERMPTTPLMPARFIDPTNDRIGHMNAMMEKGFETKQDAMSALAFHFGHTLGGFSKEKRPLPEFDYPIEWTMDTLKQTDPTTWVMDVGYLRYVVKGAP